MDESSQDGSSFGAAREDRLDSWKEIAGYLKRDVTTVQRWEKREGLPVHRHQHDRLASVYTFRSELDAWSTSRRQGLADEPANIGNEPEGPAASASPVSARRERPWWIGPAIAVAAIGFVALVWWTSGTERPSGPERFAEATFRRLTDFDGIEQAAAISPDGRFVAFLSDRDGVLDVWITQVGSSQFYNLTRGAFDELVNPSIRTLGFSPDGSLVTFWARRGEGTAPSDISTWAVPLLGGDPRVYLEGAAEVGWSQDGSRVAYHTAAPGDPLLVASSIHERPDHPVYEAGAGLHAHFPQWSPDARFIYLAQGSPPDAMDLWRIKADGGAAERITQHNARVSHPVFLDDRTLAYLATDPDGAGPWLYTLDVEQRIPQRVSGALDRYTSLAAATDGRRIVATLADPKVTLWRIPSGTAVPEPSPLSLPTGRGVSPRLGSGYLLYVAPRDTGDSVWRLTDGRAAEIWSEPGARIIGGPAIAPDGQRLVLSVQQSGRTLLYTMNVDGTDRRVISSSLRLRGSPGWSADGESIVSAVDADGTPQVSRIALDGAAVTLVREYSVDPVWSPGGDTIAYTGADIGPTFGVGAVTPTGARRPMPELLLPRGARRLRFLEGGRTLVALLGDMRHKDLWQIDLVTGARRRLTALPPDFDVRDFDVSADGREIVVQRLQEYADIVLIDLPGATRRR